MSGDEHVPRDGMSAQWARQMDGRAEPRVMWDSYGEDANSLGAGPMSRADRRRLREAERALLDLRNETSADAEGPLTAPPDPRDAEAPIATAVSAPAAATGEVDADRSTPLSDGRVIPAGGCTPAATPAAARILAVCTGNVCRSPYVERILRHELGGLGVSVSSAGTDALVGEPIDEGSAALLRARGVDVNGFSARGLTPQMVREADLVLTATREHRRLVVQQAPFALRRVFTLLDFADLCADVEFHGDLGLTWMADLVVAAGRRRAYVPPRGGGGADIVDPHRRGPGVFDRMESETYPALETVVRAVRDAHADARRD